MSAPPIPSVRALARPQGVGGVALALVLSVAACAPGAAPTVSPNEIPVLEQRLREMVDFKEGVGFEPEVGRIRQRSETRKDDAADGQSGCIFRTYLVHQMQPDNAFLERV